MSIISTIRTALYGSPPSQAYKPSKEGVIDAFDRMVQSITVLTGGVVGSTATIRATLALLSAVSATDNTLGLVYNDPDEDNNGIYHRTAGAWVFTGLLGTGPEGPGPTSETITASTATAVMSASSAAASAAVAEAFSGPTYASQAAGEAATATGQYFAVNTSGVVDIRQRTGGGSTLLRTMLTTTALASSAGAVFVGFIQAGIDAVSETVQEALRRNPVALEQFGGGVGVTDNYAAMVAAFRTNRPIKLGAGEYTFATPIDFGALNTGGSAFQIPNVVITGEGFSRTTLKYTGAGTGLKGGRTAPASGGYAQTLYMCGLTYSGNGTGDTQLGTVNNPAITYGNFTTNANNGLSGSNSTQYGIEWEMEAGCVIERCKLTRFYSPIRTKLGYSAVIRNNWITGNQIGIDVTQAVTTLSITGNLIERNAIGITLWTCGGIIIQNNAIQGNYAGCDIYSFISNRSVTISQNYFEASAKCFVQNGSNADLTLRPSNFRFEGNYALEVDIVEMASGFVFVGNSMKSFTVATANVSDIIVENNRDHDNDSLSRFTDYTGTGAANIIKNDAPLTYSQVYDPPSISNGALDAANVTVMGAAIGDFAAASLSTVQPGVNVIATVVAANTVRFEIENKSGGTLDLASGTLRVRVWKA